MATPLYHQHNAPEKPPDKCHLGLWYTRFFNRYNARWKLEKNDKREWILRIAHKICGDDKALKQHALRMLALIKALKKGTLKVCDKETLGDFAICKTNWNFVTGLGLPHPVENGFAWHHTLGVPFLTGSAIKGLLRAWVEVWDETLSDAQRLKRRRTWFGMAKGKEGDKEDKAGRLIFFDAIPIEPVILTPDIMTPHYGDWYTEGDKINNTKDLLKQHQRLPADWHEPIPVPFLAVKQAQFLIAVVARDPEYQKEADIALKSLVDALLWLGAGSKTAAGYGHLERAQDSEKVLLEALTEQKQAEKEAEEKQALRNELSSDLEKALYHDLFDAANQSISETKATEWFNSFAKHKTDEVQMIAQMLKKFYIKIDKWKKVSKKQKKKIDAIKKVLGEA